MSDDTLQQLLDEKAATMAVLALTRAVDERDWDGVRAAFAPSVLFDMSSMGAGPATDTPGAEIAAAWEEGLTHLEAVHHQMANFEIELVDDGANVFCYGTAYHYLPNDTGRNTRTFVGTYDFHLTPIEGTWRIDAMRYDLKFIDGNADLEGTASES